MKYEIRDNHNTIALLRQWFDTIDPKTYRKQNPWSGELTDAYEHYKYLDKIFIQRKAIYMNEPLLTLEATPDQHVKSIQLAIEWGEAALSSAKARIYVLANYRNAYDVTVIHSHIEEAERHLFSAMSALREARTNFQVAKSDYKFPLPSVLCQPDLYPHYSTSFIDLCLGVHVDPTV
ncbi:uncharacterized protein BO88DRAFT_456054 [Aspergillus vadensis CBS 113365]|uniref:Uncharacterized protein n=1 Tax=Aspergillus vadensis (strain CBS 113365 / IMI 142717 / IBT 24658) TaxID=1448311 RepID=A0A319B2E9_ASPVC|nr:hypothetical protein BO88DRAFT_456054 [Aspergillus vadensis CBS 113365]PYH66649.1 hypothetical protein BO88DRAFT_456054 [Aspergillus vadensis CBS 113365]